MNVVVQNVDAQALPALVDRAAQALIGAKSSAEVLEARDMASFAYDAAKRAARLAKAKDAHDSLIAAAHRAQAHALEIEAQAKMRLADEYDAIPEDMRDRGGGTPATRSTQERVAASDLGLTRKQVHDARQVRDAEKADPGIVKRTLDGRLDRGEEPTKASVREAIVEAAKRGLRGQPMAPRQTRKNPEHRPDPQYEAAVSFAGNCGRIKELDQFAPDYIAAGMDDGMRRRTAQTARAAAKVIEAVLEAIDA